jgi:hypothetical protein
MLTFIYEEYLEEPPHLAKAVVINDIIVIEFSVHINVRGTNKCVYSSFFDRESIEQAAFRKKKHFKYSGGTF